MHGVLPVAAPEQLMRVWQTTAGNGQRGSFSPGAFLDVQREARSLSGTAGYIGTFADVALGPEPVRRPGAEVTATFFDVLVATAARGRVFDATGDASGAALVVLSDGAWRHHFGADPQVVGRSLRVDGQPYEVVGVMPADFAFPQRAQFWGLAPQRVPTPPVQSDGDLLTQRDLGYVDVVARLVPGVTPREAMGELRVLAASFAERDPDNDRGRGFDLEPVYDTIVGEARPSLWLLAAAVVFPSPLVTSQASASIRLDRPAPGDAPETEYTVRLRSITPQFSAAMGIPLLAGRTFTATDLPETATSVIVSRAVAERLFGGGDVIGRRLRLGDEADDWYTGVGVAGDARSAKVDTAAEPIAYLLYTHLALPFMRLLVRGPNADAVTTAALLAAVRAEDSQLALDPPETLTALVVGSSAEPRLRSGLVGSFAVTALGLAVLGLYSLVSYTVTGRTREIATRLALGATPAAMRDGVMREGLAFTGTGLALGLGAAAALGHLLERLLYETSPIDPGVIALLVALLALASLVACYLPARRAMRVDDTDISGPFIGMSAPQPPAPSPQGMHP